MGLKQDGKTVVKSIGWLDVGRKEVDLKASAPASLPGLRCKGRQKFQPACAVNMGCDSTVRESAIVLLQQG